MNEPTFVGLVVEFDLPDTARQGGNGRFLGVRNNLVDIRGSTENFYELLRLMNSTECDQGLISYLKKARDMGAAWVIFNPSNN